MMGRKQELKNGLEEDVVYGKRLYCYLVNNNKIVKYAKRQMNKRMRRKNKKEIKKLLLIKGE